MPLLMLAAVYEKPSAWPVFRPKSLYTRKSQCQGGNTNLGLKHTHASWGRLCEALQLQRYDTVRSEF
jgi:hypothetical protein